MPRLGLVSLHTDPALLTQLGREHFLQAIGRNTGNLLFTRAVQRQIGGELVHVGFSFEPARVADELDSLVIPAANWMSDTADFGFLADRIEKADLPTVIIGLGAQSGMDHPIPQVPEGTVRLMRAISERSATLSLRGAFTAEVMEAYGITNVTVTGCPSLYWHLTPDYRLERPAASGPLRTAFHATRDTVPANDPLDEHQQIYRFAFATDATLIYQSELPEMILGTLGEEHTGEFDGEGLASYYGARDWPRLSKYLASQGRAFVDMDDWIDATRAFDFVVGTRLHGTITALLAGTPAMLVAHDSRTVEVAEFAAIPTAPASEFATIDHATIERAYSRVNVRRFNRRYRRIYKNYRKFLERNDLPHNLQ